MPRAPLLYPGPHRTSAVARASLGAFCTWLCLAGSSLAVFLLPLALSVQQLTMAMAWLETVWMKAESLYHMSQLCGRNPASGERWSLA